MIKFDGSTKEAKSGKCSYCGKKIDEAVGCRPVRLGWFCMQRGLHEDPSMIVAPEPDPRYQALKADPEVQALALAEAAAEDAFRLADTEWTDAVGQLTAVRALAGSDEGEWTITGGWRPTKKVKQHAAEETRLAPKVEALAKVRARRGEDLHEARVEYAAAANEARGRHGLAVGPRQRSAETNTIIPS